MKIPVRLDDALAAEAACTRVAAEVLAAVKSAARCLAAMEVAQHEAESISASRSAVEAASRGDIDSAQEFVVRAQKGADELRKIVYRLWEAVPLSEIEAVYLRPLTP